jgi:hypothetical protein
MIPVISIRQPWAWLIVNGHKDIENRTWGTKFRGIVLIHAGKTKPDWDDEEYEFCEEEYGIIVPRQGLDLGGIVGSARIVDCVERSDSKWFNGPYGFVLTEQRTGPFVPLRGMLGFFNVAPEVMPAEYRP